MPSIQPTTATLYYRPDSAALRYLPEGPLVLDPAAWPWEGRWLAWVGIQHGDDARQGSVNLFNIDTRENRSFTLPGRPGFVAETDRPGVLLVGMERELVLLDLTRTSPHIFPTGLKVIDHPRTIINDGLATDFGVIFGTKDLLFQAPLAHLYLYRHGDSRLITLCDGQTCSNGKAIQYEGGCRFLLDIDTPTKRLVRYELAVESGRLGPPSIVADFAGEDHFPDGMCLTPDGRSVIIAFYNPNDAAFGVARQFSLHTGDTEAEWRTPGSPRVTCPALIEMAGQIKLLLSTAIEGMTEQQLERHVNAGAFFLADTPFTEPLPTTPKVPVGHFYA